MLVLYSLYHVMEKNMPKIFPPVYLLIFGAVMWFLSIYLPVFNLPKLVFLSYILIPVGLLFDLWSLIQFISKKTTFHPLKLTETKSLVTSGLYRFSRNPMYLGQLLVLIGWACFLEVASAFLLIPFFIMLINKVQIQHEEVFLAKQFGKEYSDFCKSTRRWL